MRMKNYQRVFGVIISVGVFIFAGLFFAAPDLVIAGYTLNSIQYPAIELWDLRVVCEKGYNPSDDEWESIKKNFKRASNLLYDATDGQIRLGIINFSTKSVIDLYLADFVLTKDSPPTTHKSKNFERVQGERVRRGYIQLGGNIIPNDWYHAYSTIVHELGHYKFDLGDEYSNANRTRKMACRGYSYILNGVQYAPPSGHVGSLMDDPFHHIHTPYGTSEFCTPAGPNSEHKPIDIFTGQPAQTDQDYKWRFLKWGFSDTYTSAWTVIKTYNNSIKIPRGDPKAGPCSKSNDPNSSDSHEPLEAHQGTARFVVLVGP